MATLRNSYDGSLYSKGVGRLLLDKLIFISAGNERVTSTDGDRLKYVHGKPACFNICKNGTGVKHARYKKTLEAGLMVNSEISQGGKLFVC